MNCHMESNGDLLGCVKQRYSLFIITYFYIGVVKNWNREGRTEARRAENGGLRPRARGEGQTTCA